MTTQVTSVPNVIDALLSKIRALTAVTGAQPPVLVYDGPPGPDEPDLYVTVGGGTEVVSDGRQTVASLGSAATKPASFDENYAISGWVYSFVGGGDDAGVAGVSDAQKTARDNAYTIFEAISTAIQNDPTLAAETSVFPDGNGLASGWINVEDHRLEQTNPDDDKSAFGRWAFVHWTVRVHKRLYT